MDGTGPWALGPLQTGRALQKGRDEADSDCRTQTTFPPGCPGRDY